LCYLCGCHHGLQESKKRFFIVFYSFCMSPHCDSSSHSLCNICQSSLYYFVFSLVLPIWY
jgi:hypothetical protein